MVNTELIPAVRKQLEKFLLEKNNFQLRGQTYDLILLVPSDRYAMDTKYSLLVSSIQFDNVERKSAIADLLTFFKESLSLHYYNLITRVDFIHSEDPFVKSMKMVFAFNQPLFVINNVYVAGVNIEFGYLIKSQILDKLIENDATTIVYEEHGKVIYENAGIIKMNRNFELVYYTKKALIAISNYAKTSKTTKAKDIRLEGREKLETRGYINRISLDTIIMLE